MREPSAHAWVKAYLGASGWRQADSARGKAFEENIYEARGYWLWKVWADRYPLSSASIWVAPQYQCIPPCYASPPNCTACLSESNRPRSPCRSLRECDLSCVEDVTARYHQTGGRSLSLMSSEELMIRIQAPILVTRTLPFTLETGIVNSTTLTLSPITVTVGISEYVDSEVPLF